MIGGRRERGARRGNVLVLVLFFSMIFMIGLFSYWFVVTSEREDTVNLVREIQAQAIGDGVCAELVSLVNRAKWDQRFYFALGQKTLAEGGDPEHTTSEYYFSHADPPFRRTGPEYARGDVKFFGVIKDLDAFAKSYRIYVEVIYYGYKLTMSWDKDYTEGLIGSLNHCGTAFNKSLDLHERADMDVTDRILDQIKALARDPSRLQMSPEEAKILADLYEARGSFNQSTGLSAETVSLSDGNQLQRDAYRTMQTNSTQSEVYTPSGF